MRTADTFPGYSPDDLLGPLNDVERENAPERLYVAGARTLLKLGTRVSIVGYRKASPIGLKRARRLARSLAEHGVVVVSGLAEGIDTAAHEAAMAVPNGRTIAVLGTPLDRTYPAKNRALQRRIMEEHLAISQYPVGHPILKGNFPRRNRTMALITDATVIVEAGETSGSLSQGWEALRLGRPLFIMKSVAESGLKWPAEMRRYGADLLSDPDDLLDVLPTDVGGSLASLSF
jgi:DNA processing protein